MSTPPPRLLDQVSQLMRVKHYSPRTQETYLAWIKRFILFHHKRHPKEMNTAEIEAFLTHLALDQHVSPNTQNQALAALLFLYHHVLQQDLERPVDAVRAKAKHYLPVVMTKTEVAQVISQLSQPYQLMAQLMYGSGLRLMECLRLRVKDIDFAQRYLLVRSGKGDKDRDTLLPDSLHASLQRQLRYAQVLHQNDLEQGYGRVSLPYALARKYPNADREWAWHACAFFRPRCQSRRAGGAQSFGQLIGDARQVLPPPRSVRLKKLALLSPMLSLLREKSFPLEEKYFFP